MGNVQCFNTDSFFFYLKLFARLSSSLEEEKTNKTGERKEEGRKNKDRNKGNIIHVWFTVTMRF